MKKLAINSVLCVRHSNLSHTISERLESENTFTNVTNTDPTLVSSKSIGLLWEAYNGSSKRFSDVYNAICRARVTL